MIGGVQRQMLRIIRQSGGADEEEIAGTMTLPIHYVRELCAFMIKEGFLAEVVNGKHRLAPMGLRHVGGPNPARGYKPRATGRYGGSHPNGRKEIEEKQPGGREYSEGEIIGEIQMRCDVPPREKVEAALKKSPHSSYAKMKAQMTSRVLFCPAKGKEVTWHYCSHCPHHEKVDLHRWTVQCNYEFADRRLDVKLSPGNQPAVRCPILDKRISVDTCTHCRYWRGVEWKDGPFRKGGAVGWLSCGAPCHIKSKGQEARKVVYGGKEMLMATSKWG